MTEDLKLPLTLGRGFVDRWECDENDHLNVQFYLSRVDSALTQLRASLGLSRPGSDRFALRNSSNHIRYLAERFVGDCIAVSGGVLDVNPEFIRVFLLMRDAATHTPVAAVTSHLSGHDLESRIDMTLPGTVIDQAESWQIMRPDGLGPLSIKDEPLPAMTGAEVTDLGLTPHHIGHVMPADCDGHGWASARSMLAMVSNAAGSLFIAATGHAPGYRASHGAVALEQSLRYVDVLRPGEAVTVYSGVGEVAEKTHAHIHYLFERFSGRLVATAHVRAAYFDLTTRKIIPPSQAERDRLSGMTVKLV